MKKVLLQPAYILHTRLYRETSLLIEIFTPEHGRLTLIAKGVRKVKSTLSGLLQPFTPLLISWTGKTELMTLTHAETNGMLKPLQGECLFAGLYLNELLMHLLQKWDAHSGLFAAYNQTISILQTDKLEQKTLRAFEKYLLEELGYGVLPKSETALNQAFLPDKFYKFTSDHAFVLCENKNENENLKTTNIFSGKNLIAIAKENWQEEILLDAKRLTRFVLMSLLGDKLIHSRRLFVF